MGPCGSQNRGALVGHSTWRAAGKAERLDGESAAVVTMLNMGTEICWGGSGKPVLIFPGWNTEAATVLSWMPESFLSRFRCGVVEWPGLGVASHAPLPTDLEGFLEGVLASLPDRRVPVVGFCLGGVAAWALARLHPAGVRLSVLVDSPLHFPAVLSPLLVPAFGHTVLRLGQNTRLGRHLVRRAILQDGFTYPRPFLDKLFAFDRSAAIHYLHLFRDYAGGLRGPHPSGIPCWRLSGKNPLLVMAPALGRRHRIRANLLTLDGGGHFPAVEAPGPFFDCLTEILESRPAAAQRPAREARATARPSPVPTEHCACE